MCFFTFWTGYSIDDGIPARKLKAKKVQKKDLIDKYYKVVPIHKQPNLLDETIKLINSFWPKSRSERLSILGSSKDDLPMSLIMTFVNSNKSNTTKENAIINDIFFNSQNIDAPMICQETGSKINVLGHLRLVPVPADDKACFIESMIIRHEFRGKGLGSFFIQQAEKFCEEVLHLKSIFLSTYDSGEFYMKIGFNLTNAICVYGNGEVNNVSKKIYLKKDLNYIEPEIIEEEVKDVYDPTKDYNYNQQLTMENDIVLSGFPFKIERPKSFVDRLCSMLDFKQQDIKYYYSYEIFKREKETRSFHIMICTVSHDAKLDLLDKLRNFGVMCFQDFFERPVDEYDNTLIKHSMRYTNLNYIILKELTKLKADRWIADYKYENCQFQANQNEQWIIVKNLVIVELLRTPEIPDVPDDTIEMWDENEEELDLVDHLAKLKESFKKITDDNWWTTLRRPSEIKLEPLYNETCRMQK
ncbi:unnamed protein product [Chironomus riparius]|uniref:N-acetyltransferase domain-containing protein n=1 Tax=Chironomus riparius TaxID=315576 RepID=A0A9N9S2K1_9DIPT|nr:unnamed protein product [Chironomus riparius]